MSEWRQVKIRGRTFRVLDTPAIRGFDFWSYYSSGQWEPTTLMALDALLKPGDLLFDIGAWVGPVTLYAAAGGIRVAAFEPDPAAFFELDQNVAGSAGLAEVRLLRKAIMGDSAGTARLGVYDGGGDSQSSMTRGFGEEVEVEALTLEAAMESCGLPDLVKMDIEGGESLVLPASGPTLRRLRIPLLLGLHSHWYAPGTADAMAEELSHWLMQDLGNSMFLCEAAP